MIYDDRRSFPSLGSLLLRLGSIFLVDSLSIPAHNTRQALVRIPTAGGELDHNVGIAPHRGGTDSSPTKTEKNRTLLRRITLSHTYVEHARSAKNRVAADKKQYLPRKIVR